MHSFIEATHRCMQEECDSLRKQSSRQEAVHIRVDPTEYLSQVYDIVVGIPGSCREIEPNLSAIISFLNDAGMLKPVRLDMICNFTTPYEHHKFIKIFRLPCPAV